jgi:hypothetical protein
VSQIRARNIFCLKSERTLAARVLSSQQNKPARASGGNCNQVRARATCKTPDIASHSDPQPQPSDLVGASHSAKAISPIMKSEAPESKLQIGISLFEEAQLKLSGSWTSFTLWILLAGSNRGRSVPGQIESGYQPQGEPPSGSQSERHIDPLRVRLLAKIRPRCITGGRNRENLQTFHLSTGYFGQSRSSGKLSISKPPQPCQAPKRVNSIFFCGLRESYHNAHSSILKG